MRTAEGLDELTGGVIIEDSAGFVAQHIEELAVMRYDHKTKAEWVHIIDEGWWDLSMTVPVDPQMICFPVSVVWER